MKAARLTSIVISLFIFWTAAPGLASDSRPCQKPHRGQGVHGHYRGHLHPGQLPHGKGYNAHQRGYAGQFDKNRHWKRGRIDPRKAATCGHYHRGPVHNQNNYHGRSYCRSGYFFATQLFQPGWGLIFETRGRW